MSFLEDDKCLAIVRNYGRAYCRNSLVKLETEICNTTLPFTPERKELKDKQFCLVLYMSLFSHLPETKDTLVYLEHFEDLLKLTRFTMKMFYGDSAEFYGYSQMCIALKKMHKKYRQCVFN